jgi:NAD(P)-dependent dehydrogenase (short-subunit alcohol dehydrogenase family)
MELEGKVALVTGGARGIGRGIALALAGEGVDVAVLDVDRVASGAQQYGNAELSGYQAATATAREIEGLGRRALAINADVTRWEQVKRSVDQTVDRLGALDILVFNAGVVHI